jgi:geranylgeranyl pyrophosphate synthase
MNMVDTQTHIPDHKLDFRTSIWHEMIEEDLAEVELRLREPGEGEHAWLSNVSGQLIRAGGKRIRPALCLLSAGVFNVSREKAVAFACAVEMLHTASLVHDDVIDGAELRRGITTVNASESTKSAVLMGDYMFACAADYVAELESIELLESFARTLRVMINGEISQHAARWQADHDAYYERLYAKTAALFVLSTGGSATLAGADPKSQRSIEEYGRNLGLAFQIVDDVLDFFKDPNSIGKPIGSDLRSGVLTLPVLIYQEAHPSDRRLDDWLASEGADGQNLGEIFTAIHSSGAIDTALNEARRLIVQSQEALSPLEASAYTDALSDLASFVLERADRYGTDPIVS